MLHISIHAEELWRIGGMAVTNSLLLAVMATLSIIAGSAILMRKLAVVPGVLQNSIEAVFEGALSLMDEVLGERTKSEKYLPLVLTIFLFVLASNWLGLFPGIGSFIVRHGNESIPLLRSPSADLNFTLALAIISVIATNAIGIGTLGAVRHAKKFVNVNGFVDFFVGILELISEFVRIASFSFRLFGNIFAGEVLLIVAQFFVPYILPVPFILMEIFFGLIQAFIFAMLTLVFISIAIDEHEH